MLVKNEEQQRKSCHKTLSREYLTPTNCLLGGCTAWCQRQVAGQPTGLHWRFPGDTKKPPEDQKPKDLPNIEWRLGTKAKYRYMEAGEGNPLLPCWVGYWREDMGECLDLTLDITVEQG